MFSSKVILFLLVVELIRLIGGMNIYTQDCFADRYCFSLIFKHGGSNLTDAQNSCRSIRSKLAEISDSQIQDYATEFLTNASSLMTSNFYTQKNILINAQRYANETWSWVNGASLGEYKQHYKCEQG